MIETYEQLRDSAAGEAGEVWKAADREESNLRALYRELKDDPRYTEEHKAQKAWERYEATREKIVADKAKARDLLEKRVRTAERFSVPMPDGEHLITTDPQNLLLSQNEASRIVRKLDRLDANTTGPFKHDRVEVLKSEYQRGLEVGGVQGGAICRGVLSAADELGINTTSVVDGFRRERHHRALGDAERALILTQHISKQVPEPPFPNPRLQRLTERGRLGTYGVGGPKRVVPRPEAAAKRASRPPWK